MHWKQPLKSHSLHMYKILFSFFIFFFFANFYFLCFFFNLQFISVAHFEAEIVATPWNRLSKRQNGIEFRCKRFRERFVPQEANVRRCKLQIDLAAGCWLDWLTRCTEEERKREQGTGKMEQRTGVCVACGMCS